MTTNKEKLNNNYKQVLNKIEKHIKKHHLR